MLIKVAPGFSFTRRDWFNQRFGTWINDYTYINPWDVIIHAHPNFNGDLLTKLGMDKWSHPMEWYNAKLRTHVLISGRFPGGQTHPIPTMPYSNIWDSMGRIDPTLLHVCNFSTCSFSTWPKYIGVKCFFELITRSLCAVVVCDIRLFVKRDMRSSVTACGNWNTANTNL